VHTVAARAGLAGNPSDAYGGAAVAVPVPALAVTAEVVDGDGAPTDPLVRAAAARLGVTRDVRYTTTIPRSVGLAGSSAIIIATLRALGAPHPPLELARLALAIEVEDLGIHGGLMDRAVQAFGVPVLIDGDDARPLGVAVLPRLVIAWSTAASRPSQDVHGPLRARFDAGERDVVDAMARLAELGRAGGAALEAGNDGALADCMRATWRERVGLGIVDGRTAAMVDALDAAGVPATSAGSGGAVVGLLPEGDPPAGPWDGMVTLRSE
jgi:glucuronokinase